MLRSAMQVVVLGGMIAGAGATWAQSHASGRPRAAGPADAGLTRSRDEEPSFHEAAAASTTDIGSGGAPTTANAPAGQLRGDTPDATDTITGPIGPSDVARLVQSQMTRIRPCYEHARASRPALAGRVELRFTIGRDGHVTQSAAYGMPEAPEVAMCIADVLRQTTFPQPENGPLPFIYPINFAPPPNVHARHATPHAARH